jgi:TPR repeat protein
LAMMHRFGLGTETDYKKAVEWLFKAANRGFPDSQYHLGIMYENGWGVMKNLEVANYWLEKAKETK